MEQRSLWAQELDEDPTEVMSVASGPSAAGAGETGLPDDADVEEPGRRGHPVAWLAALTVLALLLMTLGWWLGRDEGSLSPGTVTGGVAAAEREPAGAVEPASGEGGGLVDLGGLTGGTDVGVRGGGSGTDRGGSGDSGASGPGGKAATASQGGTNPGGGSEPGSGDGDGGSGGGTGSGPGVGADVDVKAGDDGVKADVNVGVVTAPGGAVTAVTVTACAKLSSLKLDATATVKWANGFEETGVKVTGLTLLNLLDPGVLKVSLGGDAFTVPANATVKVGACLAL